MTKLFITLTLIVFIIGCGSVMATETPAPQPGPTIKAAQEQQSEGKSAAILRLELQIIQNRYDELTAERTSLLEQVSYIKIRLPIVNNGIQQLQAQIKKKSMEIQKAVAEEGKPGEVEPEGEK